VIIAVTRGVYGAGTSAQPQLRPATNLVWTVPARAARRPNPVTADTKSIDRGKQLYMMGCLPCHGSAGKGDGPVAGTLERNGVSVRPGNLADPKLWQESDGVLFWKITEGNSPMPSWGQALTEEQRWDLVNYIRTLAPKPDEHPGSNLRQKR
jgi:mono/diheme cytochrome c family protein